MNLIENLENDAVLGFLCKSAPLQNNATTAELELYFSVSRVIKSSKFLKFIGL